MSAQSLHALYEAGEISRETMLIRLANLTYATGEFDARTPYVPGQAEEMQAMIEAGQLTEEERERILRTVYAFEQKHDTEPLDHLL